MVATEITASWTSIAVALASTAAVLAAVITYHKAGRTAQLRQAGSAQTLACGAGPGQGWSQAVAK